MDFGYFSNVSCIQEDGKTMPRILQLSVLLALAACMNAQSQPSAAAANSDQPAKTSSTTATPETHDPLLDLPPLPKAKVSLIGGTVAKLDPIQNRLTVQTFGGKQKMRLGFDVRTRFYRDGQASNQRELKPGQRVYVDTQLEGTRIFAKTIWIETQAPVGDARGQVMSYDSGAGTLTLRDELSSQPTKFHVDRSAVVHQDKETRSVSDLKPGSLVSLTFGSQGPEHGLVREINVLAQPGASFSFFGKVTFLDLSRRIIAIANEPDSKTYDIYLEALPSSVLRDVRQGSEVGISAVFDGSHYVARSIELAPTDK
jgi:hypothetical protein